MYTQEQLDTLNNAIAQGALTVKYADKEVTYRNLTEMLQIRKLMMDELQPETANTNNGRKYGQFSNGLQ